jgi:hypothetical protein
MLEHERRFSDFVLQLFPRLPARLQRRVLLWLPTVLTCILRPIRVALGFCVFLFFVPFLFWPPHSGRTGTTEKRTPEDALLVAGLCCRVCWAPEDERYSGGAYAAEQLEAVPSPDSLPRWWRQRGLALRPEG